MYIPKFSPRLIRDTATDNGGGGGIMDLVGGTGDTTVKLDEVIADPAPPEGDSSGTGDTPADPAPGPMEGVNPDGSLQEGYQKNADGSITKTEVVSEEEEDQDGDNAVDDVQAFIEELNTVTGRSINVEYPEGVDPLSAQGIALRIEAERDQAIDAFEEHLRTTDPRGYAYLLHRRNGGTDEDFLGTSQGFQLPTQEELSQSADKQAALYRADLLSKGNSEEEADALVELAIKGNKLADKATASWVAMDAAQKAQLEALQRHSAEQDRKFNEDLTNFTNQVQNTIEKEIGFVVPEAKKPEFRNFLMDKVRYENGKFFIVQEIGNDSMKKTVESMFFQFQGGDLKALVAKQAKTQAAQGVRARIKGTNPGPGAGSGAPSTSTKHITLGSII